MPTIDWNQIIDLHQFAVVTPPPFDAEPMYEGDEVDMKGNLKLVSIGADVENFLLDANGKPVPCINIVGGTKHEPRPILPNAGKGFALQEDNVMLEYNIPPASDIHSFIYNLMRIQEEIIVEVGNYGLTSVPVPSMRFLPEQLQHPQAMTFGCEPDFNVWEKKMNDPIEILEENRTLRTAGGHIHIGFTVGDQIPSFPEHLTEMECIVMALDLYLGVPSLLLDKDTERRKFYGKAGAFRPKPYGLEYRVLSPFWTKEPKYMAWVYGQVQAAIAQVNYMGLNAPTKMMEMKETVDKAINAADAAAIARICGVYHLQMPK